ncbi:MAG: MmcQ/YjbR family DNA-binding protein [Clostridia bacterium]|nr:MmcQ/YjbR family DNA-binding protein [Clostridia bacterium]
MSTENDNAYNTSVENEVFNKRRADFDKLVSYGFTKDGDVYTYSTDIMDGEFRADVFVDIEGNITGRVFDLALNEEYLPIRAPLHTGAFVGAVRLAYADALERIADACFEKKPFISEQANRITGLIYEKYAESPDYPFKTAEDYGVFRCPENRKWYALIMTVEKNKLKKDGGDDGGETVEIMNVKTDPAMSSELLNTEGIYPAYHMNHKSWVSVLLDGTLSDERIMTLVDISRQFAMSAKNKRRISEGTANWIIPANPRFYDVDSAFESSREIIWKQGKGIQKGDVVYMYVGAPACAVRYKCVVTKTQIPYEYSDKNVKMRYVMKIKLLKKYPPDKFSFRWLKSIGINTVRGPRGTTDKFLEAIEKL